MSLFWKLFLADAAVVVAAVVLLGTLPITVSYPIAVWEVAIIAAGLASMLVINALTIGRTLRPLREAAATMRRISDADTPLRLPVDRNDEVGAVTDAFNRMLDRLNEAQRDTARMSVVAQEAERRRVSADLHDEVGQRLTVLLLDLKLLADRVPEDLKNDVEEVRSTTRDILDEVREISASLRPGVLEDLGLIDALRALARDIEQRTELTVTTDLVSPRHSTPERDLALYRVAQESLTNVVRHAKAQHVRLSLRDDGGRLRLTVSDDGNGEAGRSGTGMASMRDRARLVEGEVVVQSVRGVGTTVILDIPTTAPWSEEAA